MSREKKVKNNIRCILIKKNSEDCYQLVFKLLYNIEILSLWVAYMRPYK